MKLSKSVIALLWASLLVAAPAFSETVPVDQLGRIHGIAAHPGQKGRFFLATDSGLFLATTDNGHAERVDDRFNTPTSFVQVTPDGTVYAFAVDHGLLRRVENGRKWEPLFNAFGNQIPTQMMVDPDNLKNIHLLTQSGKLLISLDDGQSWQRYGKPKKPLSQAAKQGMALYQTNCQSCHGVEAVGETLSTRAMTDRKYHPAPALNGSAHAWHHTDDNLIKTILEGSSRKGGSRMQGFKEKLSKTDARDLVAYMKSFWGKRELDCQGPKHMQCM